MSLARILVVEDDVEMGQMLAESLGRHGYHVSTRTDAAGALEEVQAGAYDAVVTDLRMRGMDGIQLCDRIVSNFPALPVIVMTAFGNMDAAVAAIRAGAADFLAKPFKPKALLVILERALAHRRLQEEVRRLRSRLKSTERFEELLGESQPMQVLCSVLERIATTETSVLILGETGTGKDLAARAIHAHGARASHPFVAFNCAAVPEALMESELFGHGAGAFTSARAARPGLFQSAHGGTLFLDEVGDMPLLLQAKVLRALESHSVRPVGTDREIPVDVRVIAATHHDLERAVADGRFREDLYYRINVVEIDVPPLRARGNDVLLLAQHFVTHFAEKTSKAVRGLSSEVAQRLVEYDWPGNVRELSNCIERAVALTSHEQLIVEDLPRKLRAYTPHATVSHDHGGCEDESELAPLSVVERRHILRVLHTVGGNKAKAARILGLDRKTLYRRLEAYESE